MLFSFYFLITRGERALGERGEAAAGRLGERVVEERLAVKFALKRLGRASLTQQCPL